MAKLSTDRLSDLLRVAPGTRVDLDAVDAGATHGWDKERATAQQAEYELHLTELQQRLWAEGKHKLLVVLQGIDAAGKDGTIRHVMDAFNPQGCSVAGFKAPSDAELRPRLPVAHPPAHPGQRPHHHLQPEPLRGRARGAGPRPRPPGDLAAALSDTSTSGSGC